MKGPPPPKQSYESELIDNAIDFVVHASGELWDDELTQFEQLKYSTIHLWEGLELLLKARLVHEHWSLIVRDMEKYKAKSFETGSFVSVTYQETVDRLAKFADVELEDGAKLAFEALRQLRNRFDHFICKEPPEGVMATQLRAWHHALRLIESQLLQLSSKQEAALAKARTRMIKSEEFLAVRLEAVQPELEEARKQGCFVVTCPLCEQWALVLGDGDPTCRVCSNSQYCEGMADDYARMNNPSWKHPKHGIDDDLIWCDKCDAQACVPAGLEIGEELQDVLSHLRTEPGMDIEPYICSEPVNENETLGDRI